MLPLYIELIIVDGSLQIVIGQAPDILSPASNAVSTDTDTIFGSGELDSVKQREIEKYLKDKEIHTKGLGACSIVEVSFRRRIQWTVLNWITKYSKCLFQLSKCSNSS